MAKPISKLETSMNDLFAQGMPPLPAGGRKTLVELAPIISVVIGALSLASAWSLWHWARLAEGIANYAREFCNPYLENGCAPAASRFSVWLWLSVAFLVIEGLLYLFAFSSLKAHRKRGWSYLYYGALLNLAYAVVSLFVAYAGFGRFVGSFVGSAVGLYLLFQIRGAYLGSSRMPPTESADKRSK